MSLAPTSKFLERLESVEIEVPEVLSGGQIVRVLGLFVLIVSVLALFSLHG